MKKHEADQRQLQLELSEFDATINRFKISDFQEQKNKRPKKRTQKSYIIQDTQPGRH